MSDNDQSLGEFALLPADAAEFGLPWRGVPAVSRVTVLGGDRPVSSLRWGTRRPDVVLLHGAALNAHTWDVFALAARRPLLALDLPGHNVQEDDPVLLAEIVNGFLTETAAQTEGASR